jgi:hypothetical protein
MSGDVYLQQILNREAVDTGIFSPVLQDTDKVIMDNRTTGAVPYLPLDRLRRGPADGASQQ